MVEEISLNFNPQSLALLNFILGFVMFGIALDIKREDFMRLVQAPKPVIVGLVGQFLLLPALTWALVLLFEPHPHFALGIFLVAACPGGNTSNFVSHLARGNTALSVSLSAITTAAAVFMTPLNFSLWASFYAPTAELLNEVALSPFDMFKTIFVLLGVPLVLGMSIAEKFPTIAAGMRKPMKYLSFGVFGLFVAGALAANWANFLNFIMLVVGLVTVVNAVALAVGYFAATVTGLSVRDRRSISIEVGIQNSGLGLILVFNFFNGNGGMALVAAWWGVWHIVTGLILAGIWARRPLNEQGESMVPGMRTALAEED